MNSLCGPPPDLQAIRWCWRVSASAVRGMGDHPERIAARRQFVLQTMSSFSSTASDPVSQPRSALLPLNLRLNGAPASADSDREDAFKARSITTGRRLSSIYSGLQRRRSGCEALPPVATGCTPVPAVSCRSRQSEQSVPRMAGIGAASLSDCCSSPGSIACCRRIL